MAKSATHLDAKIAKNNATHLSKILAETYVLYLRTHAFHWNVTGPHFATLHTLFETQYTELFEAADQIAERIRALGELAPSSFAEFLKLGELKEVEGNFKAEEMIRLLVEGHETIIRSLRTVLDEIGQTNDAVSVDLVTQRLQIHEKTLWMLRSLLA